MLLDRDFPALGLPGVWGESEFVPVDFVRLSFLSSEFCTIPTGDSVEAHLGTATSRLVNTLVRIGLKIVFHVNVFAHNFTPPIMMDFLRG